MGFSKKTGKGRLDKYYYLAKEKGYRARSAFKVKQLDQKYDFLGKARVLIDLCAAPGGWLQVAVESMPLSHVIIGVDLDKIKPIKGVTTIVGDITTEKCRSDLRKELNGWKADVVLHDGAPNVGKAWIQDAFSQAELVLHAFKLASEFLVEGGIFVTKVFRSKEYPLVLATLKRYFGKVEATKPDSSRAVSAEIFVYCKGFEFVAVKTHPIDIKEILAGGHENRPNARLNLLHPEKKKVNRDGYEDNATILHKSISLSDFLNSSTPDAILADYNRIMISTEDEIAFIKSQKNAAELELFCADLKVLGRKDFRMLQKLHKAFGTAVAKNARKDDEKHVEEVAENTEEQEDPDARLFNEARAHERAMRKKQKKISKMLQSSKSHMDVANDQNMAEFLENDADDGDDDAKECHKTKIKKLEDRDETVGNEGLLDDEWYLNPIFGEVMQNFMEGMPMKPNKPDVSKEETEDSESDFQEGPAAHNLPNVPLMDKDDLVDISFNRYAFNDDKEKLPKWFVEDEEQHNVPQEPITKEVAQLLKENERLMKNRLPKKVIEAKSRQKMKALRKLQNLKKKAAVIAESEEMGEGQKIVQIRKLLSKAKVERDKPKMVIAKGRLKGIKGRPKGLKGRYKMVDRRMLKDLRKKKTK